MNMTSIYALPFNLLWLLLPFALLAVIIQLPWCKKLVASARRRVLLKTAVMMIAFSLLAVYLGQLQENKRLLREDRRTEKKIKKQVELQQQLQEEEQQREQIAQQQELVRAEEERQNRKRQLYAEFEAQFVPAANCRHPTEEVYAQCLSEKHAAKKAYYQKHNMP